MFPFFAFGHISPFVQLSKKLSSNGVKISFFSAQGNVDRIKTMTLLSELKPHFVIFDFAQDWLPRLASELGIKTLFYSVFIALSTAFATVPSRINPETKSPPTLEE
ncbi:hypothetical protein Leryth_017832 [Lithospermum erythrorhizon]|nr:hypothetical protein Leryth_017832 [Lithospermum erythrorhizon]